MVLSRYGRKGEQGEKEREHKGSPQALARGNHVCWHVPIYLRTGVYRGAKAEWRGTATSTGHSGLPWKRSSQPGVHYPAPGHEARGAWLVSKRPSGHHPDMICPTRLRADYRSHRRSLPCCRQADYRSITLLLKTRSIHPRLDCSMRLELLQRQMLI